MFRRRWFTVLLWCALSTFATADDQVTATAVAADTSTAAPLVADPASTPDDQPVDESNANKKKSALYPSLLASNSAATGAKKSPAVGSGLVTADPLRVVGGLMFVVAMILLVAWLMRRVGAIPALTGQSMRVVSALSVGTREKIILVDVAGQQILLGVAPGRVSHLQTFEQPVVTPAANAKPVVGDFAKTIKKLLQPAGEKFNSNDTVSAGKPL